MATSTSLGSLPVGRHGKLGPMTAAHPLPMPDLDVVVDDDLSVYPPEVRAEILAAEERIAGGTAQIVWEEDVPAALAEIRRAKAG